MTEDEKLLERLLTLRIHHSPGQARELAEVDFDWIKKMAAAQNVPATESSGSPSESSDVKRARVVVEALTPPSWEKES